MVRFDPIQRNAAMTECSIVPYFDPLSEKYFVGLVNEAIKSKDVGAIRYLFDLLFVKDVEELLNFATEVLSELINPLKYAMELFEQRIKILAGPLNEFIGWVSLNDNDNYSYPRTLHLKDLLYLAVNRIFGTLKLDASIIRVYRRSICMDNHILWIELLIRAGMIEELDDFLYIWRYSRVCTQFELFAIAGRLDDLEALQTLINFCVCNHYHSGCFAMNSCRRVSDIPFTPRTFKYLIEHIKMADCTAVRQIWECLVDPANRSEALEYLIRYRILSPAELLRRRDSLLDLLDDIECGYNILLDQLNSLLPLVLVDIVKNYIV